MNFYKQIIDDIITGKTYIDKQFFSKPQLYIEAIHGLPTTNPKGKTFYKNLLLAIDQLKAHKRKKAIQTSKDYCINRIEVFENGIPVVKKISGFCPPPEIGQISYQSVSEEELEVDNMIHSTLFDYGISLTTMFHDYIEKEEVQQAINEQVDGYKAKYDLQLAKAIDKSVAIESIINEMQNTVGDLSRYGYELYQTGKNVPFYRQVENFVKSRVLAKGGEYVESEIKRALFSLLNGVARIAYIKTLNEKPIPYLGHLIGHNPNIADEILDAYYRQVPQPPSRDSISPHYVGKIHRHNPPYSVSVFDAYPLMTDWEYLEYKMGESDHSPFQHYKRDKVFAALKQYGKGFRYGYENFIADKVKHKNIMSDNPDHHAQSVLDYLFDMRNRGRFSETHKEGKDIFSGWYKDGVLGGYYYAAWQLIFENHKLFEPYFRQRTSQPPNSDNIAAVTKKITVISYALLHVYLNLFGEQGVTQQNKHELAEKYGLKNGIHLRNCYTKFQDESNRCRINTDNKKSAQSWINNYKEMLSLLQPLHEGAYNKAVKDYELLKEQYSKHF